MERGKIVELVRELEQGVVAEALERLMKLFKAGAIDKTYWAVVQGRPPQDEGLIDLPLGRLDSTRGWWMKHDPAGLPGAAYAGGRAKEAGT